MRIESANKAAELFSLLAFALLTGFESLAESFVSKHHGDLIVTLGCFCFALAVAAAEADLHAADFYCLLLVNCSA